MSLNCAFYWTKLLSEKASSHLKQVDDLETFTTVVNDHEGPRDNSLYESMKN
jgi:hypothetical protein